MKSMMCSSLLMVLAACGVGDLSTAPGTVGNKASAAPGSTGTAGTVVMCSGLQKCDQMAPPTNCTAGQDCTTPVRNANACDGHVDFKVLTEPNGDKIIISAGGEFGVDTFYSGADTTPAALSYDAQTARYDLSLTPDLKTLKIVCLKPGCGGGYIPDQWTFPCTVK